MDFNLREIILRELAAMADQDDVPLAVEPSLETPLFGDGGVLDSLGLVELITAVEQEIESEAGVTVSLADEQAFSQRQSPFATVATLADYAETRVREASAA